MKEYLKHDAWNIIEEGFHASNNEISESVFSIGNGRMGHRANFEEYYSGSTFQGSYIAGLYYPDKTRVGWWKNGYPEYFAKVLNSTNWIGIDVKIDGETLDLALCEVNDFVRTLNMKEGYLDRSFEATLVSGKIVKIHARRFCSIVDDEIGAIRYSITALNFSGTISLTPYLDADIINKDTNYDEKFWIGIHSEAKRTKASVIAETKKTKFQLCSTMKFKIFKNEEELDFESQKIKKEKYVACSADFHVVDGDTLKIEKIVANLSSLNHPTEEILDNSYEVLKKACTKGFDQMLQEQSDAWAAKWKESDITIEGDVSAQQAIRFNIFQLYQTYTGEDERLNIGPKGFTGEKYGGSTYWDTEAYCLPFYMATANEKVGRNLLVYRYKHLQKAIENAAKLGFKDGAALYPMVTMNGEECHNEWEITFEEIHRNGAIAFAIYDYIRYTGDQDYLAEHGLEVLIAISRFWAQRVHFSEQRGMYVMHGVTGPNEYENNINNNWYTSTIAMWCLKYTIESLEFVQNNHPERFTAISEKTKFYEYTERNEWKKILDNMYLPEDKELGIFLQQDGYLDKEQKMVTEIDPSEVPVWQHWSWDRILRSCFIKQADVLQGIYLFEERFDEDTIRRNFDFYEPRTLHESSLSPCIHSILAAKLGKIDQAYKFYLRTARLDLDDYNNDTEDGCHITSMAGTWTSIVKGFGGMRVYDDILHFNPVIPKEWEAYSFKIRFRGAILKIKVDHAKVVVLNESNHDIQIKMHGKDQTILAKAELAV